MSELLTIETDSRENYRVIQVSSAGSIRIQREAIREEFENARESVRETAMPMLRSVDVDLREACKRRDKEAVLSLLNQVAAGIDNVSYIEIKEGVIRGRAIEYSFIPIGEYVESSMVGIEFGGVCVGDFFSRELTIDDILSYLSERGGRRGTYTEILGGIVPALLALPLEKVDITDSCLNESVQILYKNIWVFKNWVIENLDNLKTLADCLSTFEGEEIKSIALFFGEYADLTEETILVLRDELLKKRDAVADKIEKYKLDTLRVAVQNTFMRSIGYVPFRGAITCSSLTEAIGAPDVMSEAFMMVDGVFGEVYQEVLEILGQHRELRIDASESLYMRRLGIESITFTRESEGLISVILNSTDWYRADLFLQKPDERPDGWESLLCIEEGIPPHRVYEIVAYIEAILVDLVRLRGIVEGNMVKADKALGKILYPSKRKKGETYIDSLVISRRLMEQLGFSCPLSVCHSSGPLDEHRGGNSYSRFRAYGAFTDTRYLVEGNHFDYVDPDTGEVFAGARTLFYFPLRYEDVHEVNKEGFDRIEFLVRDINSQWHFLFEELNQFCSLGSMEYVLLRRL